MESFKWVFNLLFNELPLWSIVIFFRFYLIKGTLCFPFTTGTVFENQLSSLFQVCNVFLKASFFFMIKPRAQNPDWLNFLFSTGQHIQIQPTCCLCTSKFKTWHATLFWYSGTSDVGEFADLIFCEPGHFFKKALINQQ